MKITNISVKVAIVLAATFLITLLIFKEEIGFLILNSKKFEVGIGENKITIAVKEEDVKKIKDIQQEFEKKNQELQTKLMEQSQAIKTLTQSKIDLEKQLKDCPKGLELIKNYNYDFDKVQNLNEVIKLDFKKIQSLNSNYKIKAK